MKPKLLVVELWGMGDLAIGTPFLRAATEKFEVTLLAKPHASDMQPRFWPGVQVLAFIAPWTAFRRKYPVLAGPWLELLRLLRTLMRKRFEFGVSGRWDPRDHALLALARAQRRLGFPRTGSRVFLNLPLERPAPSAHRYEYWRSLARALEIEMPDRESIPMPPIRRGFVFVHTGAGQPVRVWPLERFRNLVRRLRERGFCVRVACDADQRARWLAMGETNVVTPQTVPHLLKLADEAGIFIGNDSGPGHLAALNGVPTFTLFGPQLPGWLPPLHPQSAWLSGPFCPYRPCSGYRFPRPNCLLDLVKKRFGRVLKHSLLGTPGGCELLGEFRVILGAAQFYEALQVIVTGIAQAGGDILKSDVLLISSGVMDSAISVSEAAQGAWAGLLPGFLPPFFGEKPEEASPARNTAAPV